MMGRRLVLGLLIIVAGTAGFGARTVLNSLAKEKPSAFTIVWQATAYHSDGKVELDYTETRYVSSTGNWRGVRQYANG